MVMQKNEHGKFAFVCYNDPNDVNIGFKSAADAIT
jgi:hypothetical protein